MIARPVMPSRPMMPTSMLGFVLPFASTEAIRIR
jgi:hypothetical protein